MKAHPATQLVLRFTFLSKPLAVGFLAVLPLEACAQDALKEDEATSVVVAVTPIGETEALKGHLIHYTGTIVAVGYDDLTRQERAYSPFDVGPVPVPENGTVIEVSECAGDSRLETDLPIDSGEAVAKVAHGQLGNLPDATAAIIVDETQIDTTSLLPYAPLYLRIFYNGRAVGNAALGDDIFPCSIIIDDLDGEPGNEVAVTWASVAAGYTIGATVFAIERTERLP